MLKLSFKKSDFKPVELNKTRLTIGRDPGNDVLLEVDGVSGFHAEIDKEGDDFYLLDLKSTNGTFVNGRKITEKHQLKAWEELKFDTVSAEIVDTERVRPTRVNPIITDDDLKKKSSVAATRVHRAVETSTRVMEVPSAALVLIVGPGKGKRFSLKGTTLTLGRTPENNIAVDDSTVSSGHARLVSKGGDWQLEDIGSTNGTFVNDEKISSRRLKNGDLVRLGKVVFRFESAVAARGTVVMPSIVDETKTSVHTAVSGKVPAWLYGLGGFILVCIVAAVFLLAGKTKKPGIVNARPQGGEVWSNNLPDGRQGPTTPVLADINGNGYLDVVVGDASGYIVAMDGAKGLFMFNAEVMDKILAPPVAVDLSGDGRPDIVVATNSGIVRAYDGMDNQCKMLWSSSGDLNLGAIYNRPAINDINNDGIPDLIFPTANKGLVALDGSRGWEMWNTAALFHGGVITAPVMADINGDGLMDYIAVTKSGHVVAVTGQGDRTWKLWEADTAPILYASPLYLKAGKQALIVVAADRGGIVALHAADGRMAWTAKINGRFFASPVAADADGDGVADVVAVAFNGDIHVLNGLNGDEIWNLTLGAGVQASPALFDVNDDGLLDIIIADLNGNIHIIDMNKGRDILTLNINGSGGFMASPVLADMNNDGLLDIVTAGKSGKISSWFINRETGKGRTVWPQFLGK